VVEQLTFPLYALVIEATSEGGAALPTGSVYQSIVFAKARRQSDAEDMAMAVLTVTHWSNARVLSASQISVGRAQLASPMGEAIRTANLKGVSIFTFPEPVRLRTL
jgi:hypothetical protein